MLARGYLVVRRPEWNETIPGGEILPALGGRLYCGVDRCAWFDVFDDDYYEGRLPPELKPLVDDLEAQPAGLQMLQTLAGAQRLLNYANRLDVKNEILVAEVARKEASPHKASKIGWLGYDLFAEAQWSLIARGIFAFPEAYDGWERRLNTFGLFDDVAELTDYEDAYDRAVADERSELLAESGAGFRVLPVRVGRPLAD